MCKSAGIIHEFIAASEILRVCEAMLRVFKARGDYQHKQRNRMKFMIKELGWDAWYAEYERALDDCRRDGGPAPDDRSAGRPSRCRRGSAPKRPHRT